MDQDFCPNCDATAGRRWWLEPDHVYCGLCGRLVRDVEVRSDRERAVDGDAHALADRAATTGPTRAETNGLVWLVPPRPAEPATTLVVTNTGDLPVRVTSITAPRFPDCRVVVPIEDLGPHEDLTVDIAMPQSPTGSYPRELALNVEGTFRAKTVLLKVVPAPQRMNARAEQADEWSRQAVAAAFAAASSAASVGVTALATGVLDGAAPEHEPAAPSHESADNHNRQLLWQLGDAGDLVLVPTGNGQTVLEVMPDRRAWAGNTLPRLLASSPRWEGDDVPVAVSAAPERHAAAASPASGAARRTPQRPGASVNDAPAFRLALDAGPIDRELAGTVVFELDALDRPQVRVPVRLVPGRPEWECRIEPDSLTLPHGCPSVLLATCTPAPDNATRPARALAGLIDDYRLEVTPLDLSGGPPPRVCVQRLGQAWPRGSSPQELRFRVTITPPPHPGSFTLSAQLVAVVGGRPAPLSPARPVHVHAVDPHDRRVNPGYRLVIDFGTTYTTVGRADPWEPRVSTDACQPLRDSAGERDASADMVPTLLFIRETGPGSEPHCLIGADAEAAARGSPGTGRLFKLFKPDIADQTLHEVPVPGGPPRKYAARDFVYLFLRELLLDARARLRHGVVQDLYVTCPATFTVQQRRELTGVLGRLRAAGVTGEAELLLDEANAGAFRDLDRWLAEMVKAGTPRPHVDAMIFDFGGGTIDIAALHARRRENGSLIYDVQPLGITGLRDFGGKHVTEAITRHLTRRLAEHLYKSRPGKEGRPAEPLMRVLALPWLPLPGSVVGMMRSHPPHIQAVAEQNYEFLRRLAEAVKVEFYGRWPQSLIQWDPVTDEERVHIPPDMPDWYGKLEPRLTAEMIRQVKAEEFGVTLQVMDKDPSRPQAAPLPRPVLADEWRRWLADCAITRAELDDLISPALEEALGRARRLWLAAREVAHPEARTAPYHPPDLFLLAGGSSQLPLVWKLAAQESKYSTQDPGFGFPAHEVRFSFHEAKRKVALGAAHYARVRRQDRQDADVALVPPLNALEFLLVPIVHEIRGSRYESIFDPGYRVTEQGEPQPRPHQPDDHGNLELVLYENVDYRYERWELPKRLVSLDMTAPGKEPLAIFKLKFPSSRKVEVTYRVLLSEHARKVRIQWMGPNGEPVRPLEESI